MDQVEKTEAEQLLSACANCRQSFDDGQEYFNWDYKMGSLMELVADCVVTCAFTNRRHTICEKRFWTKRLF